MPTVRSVINRFVFVSSQSHPLCNAFGRLCGLSVSRSVAPALRDRLFGSEEDPSDGLDLVALNIQRGRDHGLQPYAKYRDSYGLNVPENFEDLKDFMSTAAFDSFKATYESE